MSKAFSLLELSIVLVIIGLIAGGIVAGASMIRAAELRAVISEETKFKIALHTFRDKYFAIPGDMKNATRFWGAEPAANCPGDDTTPSTSSATCDGDGSGTIEWGHEAGAISGEAHRFWQHLANAELVSGSFTGVHSAGTGCGGHCEVQLGLNAPESKIPGVGWSADFLPAVTVTTASNFPRKGIVHR